MGLEDGELVLLAGRAQATPVFWWLPLGLYASGILYLTDRRLIWRRSWWNAPFLGTRSFQLRVGDINDCRVYNSGFRVWTRNWESYWFTPGLIWLNPFYRRATEEWVGAIRTAIGRTQ